MGLQKISIKPANQPNFFRAKERISTFSMVERLGRTFQNYLRAGETSRTAGTLTVLHDLFLMKRY